MEGRKITIRFTADQWQWADRKRRESLKEFGGAAKVKYQKPQTPGGFHYFYITETVKKLDFRTNV